MVLRFVLNVFLLELALAVQSDLNGWQVERGYHPCDNTKWSFFLPGQAITSTAQNPYAINAANEDADGLVAIPEARFAFCWIEKVGCSLWSTVLSKIFRKDPGFAGDSTQGHWQVVKDARKADPDGVSKVFKDPKATRAVFVRDPLERFASAFLDKCVTNCKNGNCVMMWNDGEYRKSISFADAVKWMLKQDVANISNRHWSLQSEHCDLKRRVQQYTHVGLFSKGSFSTDSACLLEKTKLGQYDSVDGTSKKHYFDDSSFAHHTTSESDKEETNILRKLFTPKAAMKLAKHLVQDYTTFQLPLPSWVETATGEWYDQAVSTTACDGAVEDMYADDEDDLAALTRTFTTAAN
jgi:hypothetical protein